MAGVLLADGVVFLVAFLATWLLTPVAAAIAKRTGALALPNERSLHTEPIPYLGGIAMYAGLLAAFVASLALPALREALFSGPAALGVLAAATVVLVVMTVDDIRDISPPAKIAGMVLAAGILVLLGVTMVHVRVPFLGIVSLHPQAMPLITAVWVILFCNAMNLIDGLDGLAAGVAAIAAAAMFVFAVRLQAVGLLEMESLGPVILAAVCGMALGFLRWNFHPAKVYMGDGGAMLLGLLFAAATMLIGGRITASYSGQTFFFFAPMLIPLIILGIPLADVLVSFVRRLARGQSWHVADREHLHHRLLDLGHGERRSVLMIYAWTALLALTVLVPAFTGRGNAVVPFALAGLALFLFAVFHPGNPKRPVIVWRGKHVRSHAGASASGGESADKAAATAEPIARDTSPGTDARSVPDFARRVPTS
ncbi:MAG: undecaprenyl/decaprenyl-phosphate alpha-N-acetylglucosaminyl 1-phosphate transferase [Acidimicrobiia bacterium]|nr:undecaprenyl/decaprenyl-phosphate alpha-N-acetylglucosaminyl 1-phosphate transferase [Acidimicrobiia bacterium]